MGLFARALDDGPSKPGVAGSSPAGRANSLRELVASARAREAPRLASLVASGSESCRVRPPAGRASSSSTNSESRKMAQEGHEPLSKQSRWGVLKRKANLTTQ